MVDQALATGRAQTVLVEKQVSQAVVDERAIQEFHALRLVRLAPADDNRSGFRHLAKIPLLVRLRRIHLIFVVLEGSDHQIARPSQAADFPRHPVYIAGRGARICFAGLGEGAAFRIAANERNSIRALLDQ